MLRFNHDRFKQLVKATGVPIEGPRGIARRLDVSPWTVRAWQRGKHVPRPAHVARLADLLGVEVADLYALEGQQDAAPHGVPASMDRNEERRDDDSYR